MLENVDDIVRELNWDIAIKTAKKQLKTLSAEEEKIVAFLQQAKHIDKIVEALKWSAPKVAQVLLQLEFKGIIVSLPGKVYQKCD